MTAANTNLIVDPTAQPSAGMQNIIAWLGGIINIDVTGIFAGVNVKILVATKAPADRSTLQTADWLELCEFNDVGRFSDNLNPCLVSAQITGGDGTTRIKAIVG